MSKVHASHATAGFLLIKQMAGETTGLSSSASPLIMAHLGVMAGGAQSMRDVAPMSLHVEVPETADLMTMKIGANHWLEMSE